MRHFVILGALQMPINQHREKREQYILPVCMLPYVSTRSRVAQSNTLLNRLRVVVTRTTWLYTVTSGREHTVLCWRMGGDCEGPLLLFLGVTLMPQWILCLACDGHLTVNRLLPPAAFRGSTHLKLSQPKEKRGGSVLL